MIALIAVGAACFVVGLGTGWFLRAVGQRAIIATTFAAGVAAGGGAAGSGALPVVAYADTLPADAPGWTCTDLPGTPILAGERICRPNDQTAQPPELDGGSP